MSPRPPSILPAGKKMKYLEIEHGAVALRMMRVLKQAIDPDNIMNPGKIVAL